VNIVPEGTALCSCLSSERPSAFRSLKVRKGEEEESLSQNASSTDTELGIGEPVSKWNESGRDDGSVLC
jgi:hypothetical protein